MCQLVQDHKDDIIKMYQNGKTTSEIGLYYNLHRNNIYQNLRKWKIIKPKEKTIINKYHDEIVNMFNSGASCSDIGKRLSIKPTKISYYLRKKGFNTSKTLFRAKNNILDTQKDVISQMYNEDKTLKEMSNFLKCSIRTISRYLVKNNLQKNRTYHIDETFFKKIDTQEKAYTTGIITSDGCVKDHGFSIELQIGDIDVLEKIKFAMEYEGPIGFIKRKKEHYQDTCILEISKTRIKEDLINLHIVSKKSLILKWPKFLPDDLVLHWLRGHFDGDGSISVKKNQPLVSFCGNLNFQTSLHQYLLNIGIESKIYPYKKLPYLASVTINKKAHVEKFMQMLYKDATIYMDRKHQKWIEYCKSKVLVI